MRYLKTNAFSRETNIIYGNFAKHVILAVAPLCGWNAPMRFLCFSAKLPPTLIAMAASIMPIKVVGSRTYLCQRKIESFLAKT